MKTLIWMGGAVLAAGAVLVSAGGAVAQDVSAPSAQMGPATGDAAIAVSAPTGAPTLAPSAAVQELLSFKDSDVKFKIPRLMEILSDKRHEGWVLAAYPDPKTSQPLIGAGFSLDLPAREHAQRDPLNPHPFLEPSSADLWLAAGLPPQQLKGILDGFYAHLASGNAATFRSEIRTLEPQITSSDANALLRMGIVQAVYNAKAYCRNFDRLSASQQMAMTQLVYQMGVNLEEFSTFLNLINHDNGGGPEAARLAKADAAYWRNVQLSLVQSQWARLYRERAKAVIAMLDPRYEANPTGAERRIGAVLRPVRVRRGHHGARLREASYTRHRSRAARRHARVSRD